MAYVVVEKFDIAEDIVTFIIFVVREFVSTDDDERNLLFIDKGKRHGG